MYIHIYIYLLQQPVEAIAGERRHFGREHVAAELLKDHRVVEQLRLDPGYGKKTDW